MIGVFAHSSILKLSPASNFDALLHSAESFVVVFAVVYRFVVSSVAIFSSSPPELEVSNRSLSESEYDIFPK